MRRTVSDLSPMPLAWFLLAAVVPGIAAFAEPPSEAPRLLAQVQKAYRESPSVTATFVQVYTPAGFPAAKPETGLLVLQAPNRLRFEYDGPEGKLFTFDGTAARQYIAVDKQMVVKTLSAADRARLPLLFFQSSEEVLSRFDASARPAQNGLSELTLAPKTSGELQALKLSVAPDGEVKRLGVVDADGNETAFTFTGRKPGPKRPESDFALVPPAGTRIVKGEKDER